MLFINFLWLLQWSLTILNQGLQHLSWGIKRVEYYVVKYESFPKVVYSVMSIVLNGVVDMTQSSFKLAKMEVNFRKTKVSSMILFIWFEQLFKYISTPVDFVVWNDILMNVFVSSHNQIQNVVFSRRTWVRQQKLWFLEVNSIKLLYLVIWRLN